jgi:hypothetical protein
MRKDIYLIKGDSTENYKQFTGRILELARLESRAEEISRLSVTCTTTAPPKVSVIPFKKEKIAAISVYSNADFKSNKLVEAHGFSAAYKVTEALPVKYEKNWPDEKPTPGACLLTLFQKKQKIDFKTFIDRWHNGHTPLSLKIHPLCHYNRNVVDKKLTATSFDWHGIVEEHTRTKGELINPARFFGNPYTMIYNMLRVYLDTQSFIDYKTISTYLVSEIHIKS